MKLRKPEYLSLAMVCWLLCSTGFASEEKKPAGVSGAFKNITVQVTEKMSHAPVLTQSIEVLPGEKSTVAKMSAEPRLKGMELKLLSRSAKVNSEPGYTWIEATLMSPKGKSVAYLVATVPDKGFSVGTSFKDPSNPDLELVLMLDTTSQANK